MINRTRILRQARAIARAWAGVTVLAFMAGSAAGQPSAPAGPRAAADSAAARKISIKEALQQEFLRDAGRPAEKLRWLELERDEAARTALKKSLSIQTAALGKDVSAAGLQQALALYDLVLTQSLTDNRTKVYNRTVSDREWKKALSNCVADASPSGITCTSTLANNPGVFSIDFDWPRTAGFYQTDIDASVAPDTGPTKSSAYNAQITKLFAKGPSAFLANSLVYSDKMFAEDIGFKVIGSYERPWTNSFSAGISSPLPGSKFFGEYAAADVAVKIADVSQQAAFWQVASVVNSTLLNVEQGYWNLVLAQKIYDVTTATRERVRALAEKTERLFRVQEATRYDKAKLDAQMATLKRQEHEALNGYVAASNALANLLDLDRDTILLPMRYEPKVQDSASFDLQEALREGIARNPQIRLAEVNKSIAATLYNQGRVQLKPDLSANAIMSKKQSNSLFGYQSASDALSRTFSPDSTSQTYSLNFTRPWGNRAAKANFLQAESRLRQQEILLNQTRRGVSSQITLAVTNLQSAEQRTVIAQQSRDLAEKVFTRAAKQRSLGVVSDFEVIAKSIDLLNADLDYQSALLGRKISEAAVYAAIGSLAQRYGEGSKP